MDISNDVLEKYIADSLNCQTKQNAVKKKREKGKLIYPTGYNLFNIENRSDIRDIHHNYKVK